MENSPDTYLSDAEESLRAVVVKPHPATDDSQLELQVNDIVYVLERDETGWWGGHKEGEEKTGWFPGSCVRPMPPVGLGQQRDEEQVHQPADVGVGGEKAVHDQAQSESDKSMGKHSGLEARNAALETGLSSPQRRSFAVASPQRPSGAAASQGLTIPGTPATAGAVQGVSATATHGMASAVQEDRQAALSSENSQLKRDKLALEEALRKVQRQSDVDRRNYSQIEAKMADLESKLKAEQDDSAMRSKRLHQQIEESEEQKRQVELLQAQLRRKDEEVAQLKRLSLAPAAAAGAAGAMTSPTASPPPVDSQDFEGAHTRRQLFPSTTNASCAPTVLGSFANGQQAARTSAPAGPSPKSRSANTARCGSSPPKPANDRSCAGNGGKRQPGQSAMTRSSSASCARPAEEEPPSGVVKHLRDAFESRRASSQSVTKDGRNARTNHEDRGSRSASRPQSAYTTSVLHGSLSSQVLTSQATAPVNRARVGNTRSFVPSPIATDVCAHAPGIDDEGDFGMSPIRISSEVLQRGLVEAAHGRMQK